MTLLRASPYLAIYTLLVLSARDSLFGTGFIPAFANFGFDPATARVNADPLLFNLSIGFPGSTTLMFQLPYSWYFLAGIPTATAQRLALLTIFAISCFIAVRASALICRTFPASLSTSTTPIIVGCLAALILFNVNTMTSVGLSAFVFYLMFPSVVYLIVKLYRLSNGLDRGTAEYAKLAFIAVAGVLGDPRYLIWIGVIVTSFLVIAWLAWRVKLPSWKTAVGILILMAPALLFVYLAYSFGTLGGYVSPRPLTLDEISAFSSSSTPTSLLQLLGFPWPGPVAGPFNLALVPAASIQSLTVNGNPALMILPGGLAQPVWILLLFGPSILMIFPLLERENCTRLLPAYVAFLVLFAIALGANFPSEGLPQLYIAAGQVPVIGQVWRVAFAIPNYFNQPLAAIAVFLDSVAVLQIISFLARYSSRKGSEAQSLATVRSNEGARDTIRLLIHRSQRACYRHRTVVALAVVLLMVLPAWQTFDGAYSPGASVVTLPGNHVPTLGEYSTVLPPAVWQALYRVMSDASNGSFAVAWPIASGFTYQWSPLYTYVAAPGVLPNPRFYGYLSEAVANLSYSETSTLMSDFGVRYLVVDNTSTVSNLPLLRLMEGSPGVSLLMSSAPLLWLFADLNASSFIATESPPLCGGTGLNPLVTSALAARTVGHQLIYESGLTCPSGLPLALGSGTLTPSSGELYSPSGLVPEYVASLRALAFADPITYPEGSSNVPIGNGWVLSSFSTGASVSGANGTISLTTGSGSKLIGGALVLDYLNLLFPGRIAVPVPNYNATEVVVRWSFEYLVPQNVTYFNTAVTTNDYALENNYSAQFPLATTPGWHNATFNVTVPAGARTFNIQLWGEFNGTLKVGEMNWSYWFDPVSLMPFNPQVSLTAETGTYGVVFNALGSGNVTVGGLTISDEAPAPRSSAVNVSVSSGEVLRIEFSGLDVSGILIVPQRSLESFFPGVVIDAFQGFQALTDTVSLGTGDMPFLQMPDYSWRVNGGSLIGRDSFGNAIYSLAGSTSTHAEVSEGLAMNVLVFVAVGALALWFLSAFLPRRLRPSDWVTKNGRALSLRLSKQRPRVPRRVK